MSTNHSIGRTASKSKKNRSTNLCAFTFADGRQCRTPRCSGHPHPSRNSVSLGPMTAL
jgi:hypothetical protein